MVYGMVSISYYSFEDIILIGVWDGYTIDIDIGDNDTRYCGGWRP
jgi:hypothetical protein